MQAHRTRSCGNWFDLRTSYHHEYDGGSAVSLQENVVSDYEGELQHFEEKLKSFYLPSFTFWLIVRTNNKILCP